MCHRSETNWHVWYDETFHHPARSLRASWCVLCGVAKPMIQDWTFTPHALSRALDMAVAAPELREALLAPEVKYPQTHPEYGDCVMYQRGRITLSVDEERKVIRSVLWRTAERYARDDDEEFWRDP